MAKGRAALNTSEENAHSNQDTVNPTMERAMDGMMAEERRAEILQIVRREGHARVNDLASRCRAALKARKLPQNGCFTALKHWNLPW
jgi:hypothetical protein